MSEALHEFLIDLAVNPDRMGQFLRDPAAEIERAHLTMEEAEAVLARDRMRIRAVLGPAWLAITDDQQDGEGHRRKRRDGPKKKYGDKKRSKKKTPARRPTRKKK